MNRRAAPFQRWSASGQALVELLLVLPLLLLFAAGAVQFPRLLLDRLRFEEEVRETVRRYAAGVLPEKDFARFLEDRLRGRIVPRSLRVIRHSRRTPSSTPSFPEKGPLREIGEPLSIGVGGGAWTFHAAFRPPALFGRLFPGGVPFECRAAALRHPAGRLP